MAREFILKISEKSFLINDPFFNKYHSNLDSSDTKNLEPLWKATIKKLIGWEANQAEQKALIENSIISNYKNSVRVAETDGGAISISVTHDNPQLAADYANNFMEEVRKLVESENKEALQFRLSYLSETLADALQEMEIAQKNLKEYRLQNSAMAKENLYQEALILIFFVWRNVKLQTSQRSYQ